LSQHQTICNCSLSTFYASFIIISSHASLYIHASRCTIKRSCILEVGYLFHHSIMIAVLFSIERVYSVRDYKAGEREFEHWSKCLTIKTEVEFNNFVWSTQKLWFLFCTEFFMFNFMIQWNCFDYTSIGKNFIYMCGTQLTAMECNWHRSLKDVEEENAYLLFRFYDFRYEP
jgi:hypothetical protein